MNPFFFGNSQAPLFGVYHPPDNPFARDEGIIICSPGGHEYFKTHWALRRIADQLAKADCAVMRFDYYGTGDSAGENGEIDVAVWQENICSAVDELKNMGTTQSLSIIGVRLGASVAIRCIEKGLKVKQLVLWDPVLNGTEYLETLRKTNTINTKKILHQQNTQSNSDTCTELLGFPYPTNFIQDIQAININTIRDCDLEELSLFTTESQSDYQPFLSELNRQGVKSNCHLVADPCNWDNAINPLDPILPASLMQMIVSQFSATQ